MLLSVAGVAKSFGADSILTGVSLRIDRREKVALVGRNGSGKTTLLKLITGQLEPDAGSIQIQRGAKVGYLKQEGAVGAGRTVLEEVEEAVRDQLRLRERLAELEAKMESGHAGQQDLDEYALIHEHFMEAEGYSAERDLRVVFQRMGFEEAEFEKSTGSLSGGERTRLALARLLLEEPDLLILDEPSNHLDLQATEWLEGWLRGYHGAVLLVSHDRAFLENTAERVIELRDGQVKSYPGPFDKFLQLRAAEDVRLAEVARRQEQEIAKLDEYVRRFMNSQRTAQARGRLKQMNRLIENKVTAPRSDKGMSGGFKVEKRSGDLVVEAEKLTIGFGGEPLFPPLDWTVRWGDRWGVIGENGSGKSTLLKVLLGMYSPIGGRCRLGANVSAGYFAQDAETLDPEASPLEMLVWECDMLPAEARDLLGRFLITGDDVFRPIKTLSGGEKNKLSLARLTRLNPNLLVLDEPTNHLDMDSREALASVLRQYGGTLILVSHDRWLLSNVTQQTLDIRRKGAIVFPGSYAQYRARQARPVESTPPAAKGRFTVSVPTTSGAPLSPRELSKEIERLEKEVLRAEQAVTRSEEELAEIERTLADIPAGSDVVALSHRHAAIQSELEANLAAWEKESNRLDELTARREANS